MSAGRPGGWERGGVGGRGRRGGLDADAAGHTNGNRLTGSLLHAKHAQGTG